MFKLKLVKGVHVSYKDLFIATTEKPIVEVKDEQDAKFLVSTGKFELLEEPKKEEPKKEQKEQPKRSRKPKQG